MPKIKTEKYTLEGKEYVINFNCSSKGVFSVTIPHALAQKLKIKDEKLRSSNLEDIQNVVKEAFSKFVKANTVLRLKIGIKFGASGSFVRDVDGEFIREFLGYGNKLSISGHMMGFSSLIGFDYRVIIEEDRNGNTTHYEAQKLPDNPDFEVMEWRKVTGGYIDRHLISYLSSDEKIIEYSEDAMNNLKAIESSFKKASKFLAELISSENFELLINQNKIKLLNES